MTMLRIGSMNLMLHGLHSPHFFYKDTLGKDFDEPDHYDVILMNPPFKGAVDANDMSTHLPGDTKTSELLFVHQILPVLDSGGRAPVIVPGWGRFGHRNPDPQLAADLSDDDRRDGRLSLPPGA